MVGHLERLLEKHTSLHPIGCEAVAKVLLAVGELNISALAAEAPPSVANFLKTELDFDETDDERSEDDQPVAKQPRSEVAALQAQLTKITAALSDQREMLVALQGRPVAMPLPWTTDLKVWKKAHETGQMAAMLDAAEVEVKKARLIFAMTGSALVTAARTTMHAPWETLQPLVMEILIHDAIVGFMAQRPSLAMRFYETAKPYLRSAEGLWVGLGASMAKVVDILAAPAARETREPHPAAREDGWGGRGGGGHRRGPPPRPWRGNLSRSQPQSPPLRHRSQRQHQHQQEHQQQQKKPDTP